MQGNIHVPPHATLSSCVYNISIAAAAAIAVAAVVLRLQQKGCTVNSIRFRKWQQNKKKQTRNNTKWDWTIDCCTKLGMLIETQCVGRGIVIYKSRHWYIAWDICKGSFLLECMRLYIDSTKLLLIYERFIWSELTKEHKMQVRKGKRMNSVENSWYIEIRHT